MSVRNGAAGSGASQSVPGKRSRRRNETSNGSQSPVKYFASDQQARPIGYIVDGALKIDLEIKPQI